MTIHLVLGSFYSKKAHIKKLARKMLIEQILQLQEDSIANSNVMGEAIALAFFAE